MTRQSAKSLREVLFDVLVFLACGAVIYFVATAPWAQSIRQSIVTNAPHMLLHYVQERKEPHIPELPKP